MLGSVAVAKSIAKSDSIPFVVGLPVNAFADAMAKFAAPEDLAVKRPLRVAIVRLDGRSGFNVGLQLTQKSATDGSINWRGADRVTFALPNPNFRALAIWAAIPAGPARGPVAVVAVKSRIVHFDYAGRWPCIQPSRIHFAKNQTDCWVIPRSRCDFMLLAPSSEVVIR